MKGTTEGSKMQDNIEKIGESLIQHGKYNNRVYVMKLHPGDVPYIIGELNNLAIKNGYSKIFAKIQSNVLPHFISQNYLIEAYIPGFYKNKTDCVFVSKFLTEKRKQFNSNELSDFSQLVKTSEVSSKLKYKNSLKYILEKLGQDDIEEITGVFRKVFKTYPFPIYNPKYIEQTMLSHNMNYFGVRDGGKLIGVSTSEVDIGNSNTEMTDFAVLPEYRGQNLAFHMLAKMEQDVKYSGIETAYTIARLKEPGMCKTFLKMGYKYTGTLINNTNICGSVESMNIFYKHL